MTRIRSVSPISVRYPEPNDSGALRHLTLCRIESDDGAVGWGEAVTSWPEVCRATEAMIDGIGADLVVGRSPLDNVDIWRRCKQRAWWYGNRGGISSFALSAIDIALWDLKGKVLGTSVVQLLGGAHHERLPAVASTHPSSASLEVEADRHARYIGELGFQGCKFGLGKNGEARLGSEVERDVEFIRLLRERVGEQPMLMCGPRRERADLGSVVRDPPDERPSRDSASPGWKSRSNPRRSSTSAVCGPSARR